MSIVSAEVREAVKGWSTDNGAEIAQAKLLLALIDAIEQQTAVQEGIARSQERIAIAQGRLANTQERIAVALSDLQHYGIKTQADVELVSALRFLGGTHERRS
jgi:hypothetical protein